MRDSKTARPSHNDISEEIMPHENVLFTVPVVVSAHRTTSLHCCSFRHETGPRAPRPSVCGGKTCHSRTPAGPG